VVSNNYFREGGAAYALRRPTYPSSLTQALADLVSSRGLAVDVGCGTGQLSVALAEHFDRVIATDVSDDQIKHAETRANLEYRAEPAEKMSVASDSADLIVTAQAAHWFDLDRFYAEARRIAKEGAAIALISYGVPSLDSEVDPVFQNFYWNDLHRYWPPERKHVENGYASLHFPFDPIEFPATLMQRGWNLSQLLGYIETWSAVKQATESGNAELLASFRSALTEAWADPETVRVVRWPIAVRAAYL
jgi:SAM-dependent methyltransferase